MSIRLGFLGGASSIGASCVFADVNGFRVVVDAGIRQGRGETLPDLRTLQEDLAQEAPHAFVLTHAHLDHSGALPLLVRAWPNVPILATPPTADLVRILLLDSLKIMELEREEEVPLFDEEELEQTLARIRVVGFDDPVNLGDGRIRLLPAGHILGAGTAAIEHGGRRVVVTGDVSVADQRTIPGMPSPRLRPDVLVLEATYGDRLHASREAEERRLAEQIAAAVEGGGHVLIPAFAVGRAQEVLLILRAAMRARRIPHFAVYADGMVRTVCDAYRHHARYLGPGLRRRVLRGEDPFFTAKGGFQRIVSREHREAVIEGPPCCVVASSGMLAGGASTVYARAWARGRENLIALTGYQDEEAPGRALLELAQGTRRELRLGGALVEVKAQVGTYHLSAHADGDELLGLVRRMRPRAAYVVHGDPGSRRALAERLVREGLTDVVLPEDGDVAEHVPSPAHRFRGRAGQGLSAGRPLTVEGLGEIRDLLLQVEGRRRRLLTAEDVACSWFGGEASPDEVDTARILLEGTQSAFEPDRRRPYRYRPVARAAPRAGPAPQPEALAILDDRLAGEAAGPYRASVHAEGHEIVLRFPFPDVSSALVRSALEAVRERTGWRIRVHPHPNQEALSERARAALPDDARVGDISILFGEKAVRIGVESVPDDAGSQAAAFLAATGWTLVLEARESIEGTPPSGDSEPQRPEEVKRHIERLFANADADLRPQKVAFPACAVVLHFAHPGMAATHADRLETLAAVSGRTVRIHPHPIHQQLTELVAARLPSSWEVLRPPAWVPQDDAVRVVVWTLPPEGERLELVETIREELGCRIVVEQGD